MQYLTTLLVLLLLMVILIHFKSYSVIELPDIEAEEKTKCNPIYGDYIQSQSKYYN